MLLECAHGPSYARAQDHIKRCVCLIYDPVRSVQGSIALKALRLTEAFMEVYRTTEFTAATLADKSLSWNDIFQVRIRVAALRGQS